MSNKIIAAQHIKTVFNSGSTIAVKYATKTEAWNRTYLDKKVQDDFGKAVEETEVPAGATVVVLAETEHPSTSDSKSHFTAAFQDTQGNHVATKHIYPSKK